MADSQWLTAPRTLEGSVASATKRLGPGSSPPTTRRSNTGRQRRDTRTSRHASERPTSWYRDRCRDRRSFCFTRSPSPPRVVRRRRGARRLAPRLCHRHDHRSRSEPTVGAGPRRRRPCSVARGSARRTSAGPRASGRTVVRRLAGAQPSTSFTRPACQRHCCRPRRRNRAHAGDLRGQDRARCTSPRAGSDEAIHRLLRRLNNGTLPSQPLLDLSVAGLRTFRAKQPFPKKLTDDDLRRIDLPTLLFFCSRSPVNDARRAAERSRRCMPNVEIEVVADAGHMLPVELPARFTERVLQFVDGIQAGPSGSGTR